MSRFLRGCRMLAIGCESIRNGSNFIENSEDNNLNLNLNQKNFKIDQNGYSNYKFNKLQISKMPHSKYTVSDNHIKDSWAECKNESLTTKALEIFSFKTNKEPEDYCKNSKNSNTNTSTLSFHIAAYENSVDTNEPCAIDVNDETKKLKNKNKMTFNRSFKYGILSPFEFPRQMQDDGNRESPPPEIVQFQASQTLLDPNKCSAEKTSEPRISSTDFFQSQMKKLEENQKGASQQALTPSWKKYSKNMVDPEKLFSSHILVLI